MNEGLWRFEVNRREMLRRLFLGAGAIAAGAALAGCGVAATAPVSTQAKGSKATSSAAASTTPTSSLTFAYTSDLFGTDPNMNTDTTTEIVMLQIFDRLCWLDASGNYTGGLAESWDFPDATTIRFHLRKGVKFHNGDPFTANDVKFTMDHILDPALKSPDAPTFAEYASGQVIDDYTFEAHSKGPWAPFLSVMAYAYILPQKYLQKVGESAFVAKPVGTGPFRFVNWQKGVSMQMEANPTYWGGEPSIRTLTYRPIPQAATRIAALQNDEVQFIAAVTVDQVSTLTSNPQLKIVHTPGQMIYMGLDTLTYAPLKSPLVRQALNYAVNVDSIVKNLFNGLAIRLNGPFFPVEPGYEASLAPFPYDLQKAKALLQQAGYGSGFPLTVWVAPGIQAAQNLTQVAQVIAADFGKIGVDVKITTVDPAESFSLYAAKKFQGAYIFPWGSNPTTGDHIYTLLYSKSRGYYYKNPTADQLILKYMETINPTQRAAAGTALLTFLRQDCPWVYLYEEPNIYGLRSDISWTPVPGDFLVHFDQINYTKA